MRVTLADGTPAYLDLPGGAIDGDETAEAAMVREFAEETGLAVRAGERLGRAAQYFVTSRGEPVNNRSTFFTALQAEGEANKIEDDHELVWLEADEAITRLRHDSHAWAVAAWKRSRRDCEA